MSKGLRALLGAVVLWLAQGPFAHAADDASAGDLARGRALYLEGRRADGAPLQAWRAGGLRLAGAEAACVNCHRRSGLGGAEGRSYIPPITANALLNAMPPGKGPSAIGAGRPAYGEDGLALALRAGLDPGGRRLDYLMPRYELRDDEAKALLAYLRSLSEAPAGVAEEGELHFATVLTPEVAPARREAMLGVLQACFDEHNAGPAPERGRKRLAEGMRLREQQPWRLHVWTLEGPEEGWQAQLVAQARQQPVFAVVGGAGAGRWKPVHAFCEQAALPCLFPQVEAPVADAAGFYPLYLGKGVLLEAGLIAAQLARQPPASHRLVQVLRADDAAATVAADALADALGPRGFTQERLAIAAGTAFDPGLLAGVGSDDALVLWLRPADLQRLAAPAGAQAFLSATLAERDAVPLAPAWRERTLMAYPFELPAQRAARMTALHDWLRARGQPLADERAQADAHVACSALRAAMDDAAGHVGRDYLVERLEANLERGTASGLYPRLALGIGQRFASKAGYLVRFDAATGALVAAGEREAP